MSKKSYAFQEICLLEMLLEQKRQGILIGEIMTQVNDLASKLEQVNSQLAKASGEIAAQIAALQTALENVALPADAETALANLAVAAQALDDMNPDAPVEPAQTEEPAA